MSLSNTKTFSPTIREVIVPLKVLQSCSPDSSTIWDKKIAGNTKLRSAWHNGYFLQLAAPTCACFLNNFILDVIGDAAHCSERSHSGPTFSWALSPTRDFHLDLSTETSFHVTWPGSIYYDLLCFLGLGVIFFNRLLSLNWPRMVTKSAHMLFLVI